MMRFPRWMHKLYAYLLGYFWMSCTICSDMWGGHEWGENQTLRTSWAGGVGVCPNCKERVKVINDKFFKENPSPPVYVRHEA